MTGASDAHFLGSEHLRAILAAFFATQVLSPSFYLSAAAFTQDKRLLDEHSATARRHGRALCELAVCIGASEALKHLTPLV
jgi:FMN reductase